MYGPPGSASARRPVRVPGKPREDQPPCTTPPPGARCPPRGGPAPRPGDAARGPAAAPPDASGGPLPPRPPLALWLLFVLSVLFLPLWWLPLVGVVSVLLVFSMPARTRAV